MSDFPNSEELRAITEKAKNSFKLDEITKKYINECNKYAKITAEQGKNESYMLIAENDINLNRAIATKINSFLIEKGYSTELNEAGDRIVLHFMW